jgi:hypothetical protein
VRSYLIDELLPSDREKIIEFLKHHAINSELEDIFWIEIPQDVLSDEQYGHRDCQPFVFAIELGRDWIKLEFFIRSLRGLRCRCQDYVTHQQRDFILGFAQRMIESLNIKT